MKSLFVDNHHIQRLNGFASLHAGSRAGTILTKPLPVDGSELRINADASRGEIRVELRDAGTGRVIPGYGMGEMLGHPWLYSEDGQSKRGRFGTGARFLDDCLDDESLPISKDGYEERV